MKTQVLSWVIVSILWRDRTAWDQSFFVVSHSSSSEAFSTGIQRLFNCTLMHDSDVILIVNLDAAPLCIVHIFGMWLVLVLHGYSLIVVLKSVPNGNSQKSCWLQSLTCLMLASCGQCGCWFILRAILFDIESWWPMVSNVSKYASIKLRPCTHQPCIQLFCVFPLADLRLRLWLCSTMCTTMHALRRHLGAVSLRPHV